MKITINGQKVDIATLQTTLVAKSSIELDKDVEKLGEILEMNGNMIFEWCDPIYMNVIGEYSRKVSFFEEKRNLIV